MAKRRLWVKRRGAPRWALLVSWIVAAAVWLWVINVTVVRDRPWSSALANASGASRSAASPSNSSSIWHRIERAIDELRRMAYHRGITQRP